MPLLDNLPHECTIRRRTRSSGALAGSKDSTTDDQTGVACWEQAAGTREVEDYEKRGIIVSRKVYFAADPGVTEQHQIVVTKRLGVAVPAASQVALDVKGLHEPDASAGMGALWRVMCDYSSGSED